MKEFNTTGICNPEKHYMVDISGRIKKIKLDLVDKGKYFCINRARQYGKTTTISALKKFLSADYIVVGLDFQQLDNDVFATGASFAQALSRLFLDAAEFGKVSIPDNVIEAFSQINNREEKNVKMDEVFRIIRRWCSESKKPVVLIIDEVDSATNNQVFLDFLAQLREAYLSRESDGVPAFQSVILAGVTDVKHLKSKIRDDDSHKVNSPWNIAEDFTLDMSLSEAGIEKMLEEYSADHNISINATSIAKEIREYTSGYPFLVSRICKYIDKNLVGSSDRFDSAEKAWTTEGVSEAVRRVLNESNTLFESLMGKVQTDEELSGLLQTILFSGERISYNIYSSSISLASMYGFVRDDNGAVAISNRIFETVLYNYYLSREEMKNSSIYSMGNDDRDSLVVNGKLQMEKLLKRYIEVYDDIYDAVDDRFLEEEGRRRFLLYIRPIINGTGNYYIEARTRNTKRMDLVIDYNGEQFIIELKIWRGREYHKEGEIQLADYLESKHLDTGYMLTYSFNKNKEPGITYEVVDSKHLIEALV